MRSTAKSLIKTNMRSTTRFPPALIPQCLAQSHSTKKRKFPFSSISDNNNPLLEQNAKIQSFSQNLKTQKPISQDPILSQIHVTEVLISHKNDPFLAFEHFKWASGKGLLSENSIISDPFIVLVHILLCSDNKKHYGTAKKFINKCASECSDFRSGELVSIFVSTAKRFGFDESVSCRVVNFLLCSLVRSSRFDHAIVCFTKMVGYNIVPCVAYVHVLLNALVRNNMVREARVVFDDIVRLGILYDCATIRVMIRGCLKEWKVDEAAKYFLLLIYNNKKVDLMKEDGDVKQHVGKGKGKEWESNKGLGVDGNGDDGPRFKDLGGMFEVLKKLKNEVLKPFIHPDLPRSLGGRPRPITGILLHGPPGCGKTTLAHAIANETGVAFHKISATELVSGISGASEENIRELFSKAYRTAPSMVFIDEIDAIASKRENLQREMERRIVTELLICMDESYRDSKNTATSDGKPGHVLVIGATNRPDALDPALRRPGRFDEEIFLGVPDENARVHILSVLTKNLKLENHVDLVKLSRATPGFVGADLSALMTRAINQAINRIDEGRELELIKIGIDTEDLWKKAWTAEEKEKLSITMSDFEAAAELVKPSSKREGFTSIPDVKWEDVGGLDLLREQFERYIVRRLKSPDENEEYGMDLETGFLLYGPPGCGKSLIAKAVANEAGANFIHVRGPELLSKYVGESELAVRTIFSRARTCSPCILFFDEVDALTKKRGTEGAWVVERLLNQLLIELDGGDQRKGVFIIGATNRPDVMDPALLRPGRFGKLVYVPLPTGDERALILKALSKKRPLDDDVDLVAIARSEACAGFSGADLKALVDEAALASVEEKYWKIEAAKAAAAREGTSVSSSLSPSDWVSMPCTIKAVHFEQAFRMIPPSLSDEQKQYYHLLQESFKRS